MAENEEQKYAVTHGVTLHAPPITRDEVPAGAGACDAVLTISILKEVGGDVAYAFSSLDGTTSEELSVGMQFRAWCMLASLLKDALPPGEGRQELCALVHKTVSTAAAKASESRNKPPTDAA